MKNTIQQQDVQQKLDSCIFRYKGVPYYVRGKGSSLSLYHLYDSGGASAHTIHYNDPDLDISSIPLGYVNVPNPNEKGTFLVSYFTRIPIRRVKQGVTTENTNMSALPGANKMAGKNNVMFSKAMVDSIMGDFPKLDVALKDLRKLVAQKDAEILQGKNVRFEIAISRSIALVIDQMGIIRAYHKNVYIGWIAPDDYIIHVKSNDLGWIVSKYLHHILGWKVD